MHLFELDDRSVWDNLNADLSAILYHLREPDQGIALDDVVRIMRKQGYPYVKSSIQKAVDELPYIDNLDGKITFKSGEKLPGMEEPGAALPADEPVLAQEPTIPTEPGAEAMPTELTPTDPMAAPAEPGMGMDPMAMEPSAEVLPTDVDTSAPVAPPEGGPSQIKSAAIRQAKKAIG